MNKGIDIRKPYIRFGAAQGFEDIIPVGFLPRRETRKAAGYDIHALVQNDHGDLSREETIIIKPGETATISTGLTIYLPDDLFLDIRPRSGLAMHHNITLQNSPATIDADFAPNEIKILLRNEGFKDFAVRSGMRIAQGVILRYYVTDDDNPVRDRDGGLGHTGV